MEQTWFEMTDRLHRRFSDAVWVPLKRSDSVDHGTHGQVGYRSDFMGVRTLAIPLLNRDEGNRFSWSDNVHDPGAYAYDGGYKPAEIHQMRTGHDLGIHLALRQGFDGAAPATWHLNQDVVFALGLLREGDIWLRPDEGYLEIVRLQRRDGRPVSLEIRSEHLKDYLAARSMALRITSFQSRDAVLDNAAHIAWSEDGGIRSEVHGGRFEGRVIPIHEGGHPFGATAAVFHMSRTDVDLQADVPVMGPMNDGNVASKNWEVKRGGSKLFRVLGEFWRDEWLEPAALSLRVRGDKVPSPIAVVVGADGSKAKLDDLQDQDIGRWLWFSPQVVATILARRGGKLDWYTRYTGSLELAHGHRVHFGLNDRDLINAYAFDIAILPEWQRSIWAGFNVAPDGGVCTELLSSQVEARPADSQAPERYLREGLDILNIGANHRWGIRLAQSHELTASIVSSAHRFRGLDRGGLFSLAKDLARLTADAFDSGALQSIAKPAKGERLGTLKLLERALAQLTSTSEARALLSVLVGVYDLRLGDAHLPSTDINDSLQLVGVDPSSSAIKQAEQLLSSVVSSLFEIAEVMDPSLRPPQPNGNT